MQTTIVKKFNFLIHNPNQNRNENIELEKPQIEAIENNIENVEDDLEDSAHEDDPIQSHSQMRKIRKMRSCLK